MKIGSIQATLHAVERFRERSSAITLPLDNRAATARLEELFAQAREVKKDEPLPFRRSMQRRYFQLEDVWLMVRFEPPDRGVIVTVVGDDPVYRESQNANIRKALARFK